MVKSKEMGWRGEEGVGWEGGEEGGGRVERYREEGFEVEDFDADDDDHSVDVPSQDLTLLILQEPRVPLVPPVVRVVQDGNDSFDGVRVVLGGFRGGVVEDEEDDFEDGELFLEELLRPEWRVGIGGDDVVG